MFGVQVEGFMPAGHFFCMKVKNILMASYPKGGESKRELQEVGFRSRPTAKAYVRDLAWCNRRGSEINLRTDFVKFQGEHRTGSVLSRPLKQDANILRNSHTTMWSDDNLYFLKIASPT